MSKSRQCDSSPLHLCSEKSSGHQNAGSHRSEECDPLNLFFSLCLTPFRSPNTTTSIVINRNARTLRATFSPTHSSLNFEIIYSETQLYPPKATSSRPSVLLWSKGKRPLITGLNQRNTTLESEFSPSMGKHSSRAITGEIDPVNARISLAIYTT